MIMLKEFRQINYLVISLVKPLLSRNFCENNERQIEREFLQFPDCECEKTRKYVISLKKYIFCENNSLATSLLN